MLQRFLLILIPITVCHGCQLFGDHQKQGIFFETNRSDYIPGDTIELTFENRTGNALSVRIGCETGLRRLTELGWERVVDPTIGDNVACALPGFSYEPGFTMSSKLPIPSWWEYGTYRFEWEFAIERTNDRDIMVLATTEPFQSFVSLPGTKVDSVP